MREISPRYPYATKESINSDMIYPSKLAPDFPYRIEGRQRCGGDNQGLNCGFVGNGVDEVLAVHSSGKKPMVCGFIRTISQP